MEEFVSKEFLSTPRPLGLFVGTAEDLFETVNTREHARCSHLLEEEYRHWLCRVDK
jgi:hypothetical protein